MFDLLSFLKPLRCTKLQDRTATMKIVMNSGNIFAVHRNFVVLYYSKTKQKWALTSLVLLKGSLSPTWFVSVCACSIQKKNSKMNEIFISFTSAEEQTAFKSFFRLILLEYKHQKLISTIGLGINNCFSLFLMFILWGVSVVKTLKYPNQRYNRSFLLPF